LRSITLIISIIILSSCSSQWHLRKAIKKDPTIVQIDTITFRDTIKTHTELVRVDSVFKISSDTTIIIKENLTIKHFIRNDSVFIEGSCDTIFLEIPYEVEIPVDKWIYPESNWLKDNWILLLIVVAIGYIIISTNKKR